jgi:hypothetical protein
MIPGSRSHDRLVREAMEEIVTGRYVKRGHHDLKLNAEDLTATFIEVLREHRFEPMTVGQVNVAPGERIPAFYVAGGTATFGWVFWEKFTENRQRKLFGSIARNPKGDWAIQIPPSRNDVIYVNAEGKIEMDIDHPHVL